jgi:UDP-N-acetylmuramyl pentapeptide phosphotransferase/UDP-N-acetylglucosamine-1-phosphate transferase
MLLLYLFISSFLISFLISLAVIFFSHKHNFFIDSEKEEKPQKFHTDSTPRAAGIGIMSSLVLLFFTSFGFKLFIPSFLAFLSGIFEDFHNSLSAKVRLLMQIVAAISAVYIANAVITYLGLGIELPYTIGVVFSIFAIVGMINAVNIIDGFNGLAAGVVILILSSLLFVALENADIELSKAIVIVLGATFGVFILIFPYGKIFLGDGGAYLLGFLIGIFGIFLASKYDSVSPWYILALFIYPVWEVLFSIIRKLSMGKSPMEPDRHHMHMLVFRVITKNNPLTAVVILLFNLPFMIYSTIYANCSKCNVKVTIVFIVLYCIIYFILYKKDKKLNP